MKKLITLTLLLVFTLNSYSQDYLKLKNGTKKAVVVLEVNPDNIKYKDFDNQNGATYTILKCDAISILYQNGKEEKLNSEYDEKKLTYEKEKINLDGVVLNNTEIKELFKGTSAMRYYNLSRAGNICAYTFAGIGGGFMGLGITGLISKNSIIPSEDALPVLIGGAVIACGGILMVPISNNNKKKAVNEYNQSLKKKNNLSLNMGFTSNGVGLTLHF